MFSGNTGIWNCDDWWLASAFVRSLSAGPRLTAVASFQRVFFLLSFVFCRPTGLTYRSHGLLMSNSLPLISVLPRDSPVPPVHWLSCHTHSYGTCGIFHVSLRIEFSFFFFLLRHPPDALLCRYTYIYIRIDVMYRTSMYDMMSYVCSWTYSSKMYLVLRCCFVKKLQTAGLWERWSLLQGTRVPNVVFGHTRVYIYWYPGTSANIACFGHIRVCCSYPGVPNLFILVIYSDKCPGTNPSCFGHI